MLSSLKPIVEPAATLTVAEAAPGETLQRMFGEVTLSTGELLIGWRTAAVEVVLPAIKVFQMSKFVKGQRRVWLKGRQN